MAVAGGEGFARDIVSLEPSEEYLFFVYAETQDAPYRLVGIDAGAFQAQSDGSYANPVGMAVEASEVQAFAQRAAEIEG